jgi:hypothetical protein
MDSRFGSVIFIIPETSLFPAQWITQSNFGISTFQITVDSLSEVTLTQSIPCSGNHIPATLYQDLVTRQFHFGTLEQICVCKLFTATTTLLTQLNSTKEVIRLSLPIAMEYAKFGT